MLEIELVVGDERAPLAGRAPGPGMARAARAAARAAGVDAGHMAIALVGPAEMRRLNREHCGRDGATDVLAFPVDGPGASAGPRELGDVVVCPKRSQDLVEAVVHGVLHLCGFDHEHDSGEMLALQRKVLEALHAR